MRGESLTDPPLPWRLESIRSDPHLPLVVALHGWGMDEDLFAARLRRLLDGPFRVLIPRAPYPIPGRRGASWYHYDGNQERFRAQLDRTESLVLEFLRAVEREQGLIPDRRWLLGFSQGGYCGSWIALRHPECFAGMAIVGARVKTEWLGDEMRLAAESGFEALLCHGLLDETVPPAAARRSQSALEEAGVPVRLRTFDSGHSIGRAEVQAIREWLDR